MSKLSNWLWRKWGVPEQRIRVDAALKDYILLRVGAAMQQAHVPTELQTMVLKCLKESL